MRILSTLLLTFITGLGFSQATEAYFTSFPTLSPDGQTVVFTFDGDLWKVSSTGGTATRLTAMQGDETRAHISPDGNWLAFSSTQNGNHDVYLMSLNGGLIKQLTFHEGYDHVDGWSWDSKSIYFTSNRSNRNSGYKVPITGGTPVRLFGNFFNTVHTVVEHPSSGEIFFNETWESKDNTRKRYKGAYNPDIQSYNLKTNEFKKYTTYNGKDLWPSFDKNGKLYFASDEANGESNLYTFDNEQKTALTSFPTSVKYPFVNATGDKVVFEKDFQLYLFDVKTKSTQKLSIQVYQNPLLIKEKDFNVQDKLETMSISPDGKKLAFVSRGELFASDIKGKFVQQMKTNSLGRVMEVRWTQDNKTLLYNQTSENGFLNLFTISADGKGKELQLTHDNQNNRDITTNKEGTKAVYYSGRNEVRLIDLKTFQNQTLVNEELWGFGNPNPYLSPNDEYVMFTAHRNFEEDIFLFHIGSKKLINLTQTGITETSPFWSPDGQYIYFASDRIKPGYPYGLNNAHIYRLSLEKLDEDFKSGRFDSLFVIKPKEEKKPEEKNKKDKKEVKEKTSDLKPYTIELEDIMHRIEQVSPDFGNQARPQVFQKDGKTYVLYTSDHEGGTHHLWMNTYESFEKKKTEKIEGTKDFGGEVVKAEDKFYTIINGNPHTIDLSSKKVEKIEINFTFRRNLANEFTQMFHETWANLKENFYNEDFHGTDWEGMHKRYESFLPYVNTRANLRALINDMLGELNSSHLGFSSNGDEEKLLYTSSTLGTGILFDNLDPYKVSGLVKGSPTDKKDKDVKAGDRLVAVNGENVVTSIDRDFYFLHPSLDQEISLTFDRSGISHQVKLHPKPFNEINSLLYDEWIENNQRIVDEKGQKRIAYAYMRNMGQGELSKFFIDMNTEAYKRDGLILDLRYNTGGNVHDDVLRFLSQRPYLKWKYREGAFTVQSNFTPAAKPLVLLINEQSLSDAEMTATGFKELKLGKIIGTETYRWIIFTSGKGLVDGSFYRLPSWGCYTLDGKNIEKEGVKPDIFVETNFKDRLENRDPQLDKAIEDILKDLK